ncbi:CARDB domain-containing protein [uncultured Dokdonia sp.]|uniref:CARDB domain-containing protein n=1 Tax=uncultured Dokdonia sp. TaxID=575653 RepID=UPI0026336C4A|nr:CARDB domain-containing protein [uncultured Dokdonia sp.]
MKNKIKIIFSLAIIAMVTIACSGDEEITNETTSLDFVRMPTPINPVPALDLIISSYTTNIPSATRTTACGGVSLPDVSCGGQRGFVAFATVTNVGPGNLPAGSLDVEWTDFTTGSSQLQTISHGGISSGGTLVFQRTYFLGPCDCPVPSSNFTHVFFAVVDPNNNIPETNENNNTSPRYVACDGC